jgi:hypothetical protein
MKGMTVIMLSLIGVLLLNYLADKSMVWVFMLFPLGMLVGWIAKG